MCCDRALLFVELLRKQCLTRWWQVLSWDNFTWQVGCGCQASCALPFFIVLILHLVQASSVLIGENHVVQLLTPLTLVAHYGLPFVWASSLVIKDCISWHFAWHDLIPQSSIITDNLAFLSFSVLLSSNYSCIALCNWLHGADLYVFRICSFCYIFSCLNSMFFSLAFIHFIHNWSCTLLLLVTKFNDCNAIAERL